MPAEKFNMPSGLKMVEETATESYAKFVTEPWEKGFGHTLGNALRRVLLSSLEGVAVKTIRIDGVPHEFTTIPNVMEDATEVVMNVKQLRFICDGELPRTLHLYAEKAGPVCAGDIRIDSVTEVVNPDLVLFNLDKDSPVHMEFVIDKGRGYVPAEANNNEDDPIGVIPVDSLYSPIDRVRYDVYPCRVGNRTDYDKLELEVWTDGRIDPQDAVREAARLLREHLNVFAQDEEDSPSSLIVSPEDRELLDKLLTKVDDIEFSVRAKNCLSNADVTVIGDLVERQENELLKFRNFGRKSLDEIKEKLCEMGISLGMALKEEIRLALKELSEKREG